MDRRQPTRESHAWALLAALGLFSLVTLYTFTGCGDADITIPGSGLPTLVPTGGTPTETPEDEA